MNSSTAATTHELSLKEIQTYVKQLAQFPQFDLLDDAKRTERICALKIRDALFAGKKPTARKRRLPPPTTTTTSTSTTPPVLLKGDEDEEIVDDSTTTSTSTMTLNNLERRSCSPVLFAPSTVRSMLRKRQKQLHVPFQDTLLMVSESLYQENKSKLVFDHQLLPPTRINSLGTVLLPIRRKQEYETWSPHEIAVFESAIALYGKQFRVIATLFTDKSTSQVISFYYSWKNTSHGKAWKKAFTLQQQDGMEEEEDKGE